MSKIDNKSKMKRVLIIVVVVILILVILLSILLRQPTNLELSLKKLEYINSSNVEQWEDGTFYPENAAALGRAYQGNLSVMNIGKSMYYVTTEVFPKYYDKLKNASKEKIEKYFRKESKIIYTDLAINNQDAFVKLIRELQSLSGKELKLESYALDMDTIQFGGGCTKVVLYVTYSGNKECAFNLKINNKMSVNHSSIEYSAFDY